MELIDTHCHLHFKDFDGDRAAVLKSATAAGVKRMVCPGTSLEDSRRAVRFAKNQAGVWSAAGVHPHEAEAFLNDPSGQAKLAELLGEDKVAAVGEIGLDYYKDYAPRLEQEKAFRSQLETGLETGLPFIFHVRDAWADFWRVFDEHPGLRGVVHSFSSGANQLDAALARGLYVGLNGIMTFTKDQAQLAAAKQVPDNRLLLETDAPFLAPAAFRGRRCEPGYVAATAEFLAKLRGQSTAELAKATTENAIKLFNLS